MMKRRYTLILLVLLAGLFVACEQEEKLVTLADAPQPESAAAKPVEATERLVAVRRAATATEFAAVGSFSADKFVLVAIRQGGTITKMPYDVGDAVQAGAPLAVVETEGFRLALRNARAQLKLATASAESARREHERKRSLAELGAVTPAMLDQLSSARKVAEAQQQSAEVAVAMAKKSLREATTTSPVRGVVSKRLVDAGEYLALGDPMMEIMVNDPAVYTFSVPQHMAARILPGAEVSARLNAYPERSFVGTVRRILPVVDARTRSLTVEAEFANADGLIRPGFFANSAVSLTTAEPTYLVPTTAVVNDAVVVEREGQRVQIPVVVVGQPNEELQVIAALLEGDMVVLPATM